MDTDEQRRARVAARQTTTTLRKLHLGDDVDDAQVYGMGSFAGA